MSQAKDPGLGSKYKFPVERMIREDGSYNIIRKGGLTGIRDFYKYLISVNWLVFFVWTMIAYMILNCVFALFYLAFGMDQISGADAYNSEFVNAFFFSVQTFTTVGYGYQAPVGFWAGFVAMIEAFWGLMFFALITGLLYGRFSKPIAKIGFSKNVLITPFKESNALMFKIVNRRRSVLLKSSVKCILSIDKGKGDHFFNKTYHRLELEIDTIDFFPLTWTIVHPINESSPIHGLSAEDLKRRNAELIVMIETFDETFAQYIIEKHSYAGNQWLKGYRFEKNFSSTKDGTIELHVNEIDRIIPLDAE